MTKQTLPERINPYQSPLSYTPFSGRDTVEKTLLGVFMAGSAVTAIEGVRKGVLMKPEIYFKGDHHTLTGDIAGAIACASILGAILYNKLIRGRN